MLFAVFVKNDHICHETVRFGAAKATEIIRIFSSCESKKDC